MVAIGAREPWVFRSDAKSNAQFRRLLADRLERRNKAVTVLGLEIVALSVVQYLRMF